MTVSLSPPPSMKSFPCSPLRRSSSASPNSSSLPSRPSTVSSPPPAVIIFFSSSPVISSSNSEPTTFSILESESISPQPSVASPSSRLTLTELGSRR